ncbi:bifunctional 4-hydroxy-2-oxoglutarate aldolase/2-dehydro-3-deoxy-phosphogluconate aldolase [Orrella sp. JC864]|uniref:bifunctional 4-hydroxy-2-oxoglutarate aldolase/2-dehydro-3-deoxy-phosphogluconate aldolase n=1 Tax=Orrella sp. JC864 TaxID=3120298 RepID=UPI0012BB80E1
MTSRLSRLTQARVVPVLRYADADTAFYAAEAAAQAGFASLELTWTIPGVAQVLAALRQQHGDRLLLGVGTLTDAAQAEAVLAAGADFLVSPAVATEIVAPARQAGALCLLGAFTPTEVLAALRAGADVVKIFPADSGGPAHLAALRAVFPEAAFCPTGGIARGNMADYFKAGATFVGIGSSLFDKQAFAARDTAAVVAGARAILEAAHA